MRNYPDIGVQVGEVLLPKAGIDLKKWAVIACDQYTSQPEYWQQVQALVGAAPSTYHLILPEVYLGAGQEQSRIQSTQAAMRRYLEQGLLAPHEGIIYVERRVSGRTRHGVMLALDLEKYDFSRGSQSLIRATEGTILERLPPRMRIREGAPLELPHILVLIDDPQRTVIEPLSAAQGDLQPLYETELMAPSGSLRGYLVDRSQEARLIAALRALADPRTFQAKYGVGPEKGVLLFAVGDGNHSLATAKSIWEQIKPRLGKGEEALNHPARYALVEVENVHDQGLSFEPIHRVLFGLRQNLAAALQAFFGSRVHFEPAPDAEAMMRLVDRPPLQPGEGQSLGIITPQGAQVVTISRPESNLPVGTLQAFLDDWLERGGFERIDYVHGSQVVRELGSQPGNAAIFLPPMQKSDLFKTVILDGVLPRKTFSMGEAHEKRFYMECRIINRNDT